MPNRYMLPTEGGDGGGERETTQVTPQDLICCPLSLLRCWLPLCFSPGEQVMSSTQHSAADRSSCVWQFCAPVYGPHSELLGAPTLLPYSDLIFVGRKTLSC